MDSPPTTHHSPLTKRRGSAYLVVLGTAMLVALLGLASLTGLRIQRRVVDNTVDAAEARAYAQAAIEVGMLRIAGDQDWRTNNSDGVWIADQPLGSGTFTLEGHDPGDGDLANDDSDDLLLVGTGITGRARQKTQVRLVPQMRGVGALQAALFAGGTLSISGAAVQSDGLLAANGDVAATSANINADVEAAKTISGGSYNGSQTAGVDARSMPSSPLTPYMTSGTPIPISNIPLVNSVRTLENLVLSPSLNPFGATNSQGVYVVDCQGEALIIQNSRIIGTLVLVNAGAGSKVSQSVNWAAAVANYPALLVDGGLTIDMSASALSETLQGVNFNPDGASYLGLSDLDMLDTYPSQIQGLVYAGGSAVLSNSPTFDGVVVVAGDAQVQDNLTLTYDSTFLNTPPPGFLDKSLLKVSLGSWSKDVD